jgi:hypothetical protein
MKYIFMRADKPHPTLERWSDHLKSKAHSEAHKQRKTQQTQLFQYQHLPSKEPLAVRPQTGPCPGLGQQDDDRIPRYLERTAVPSGGAPPRWTLRREFEKEHSRLCRDNLRLQKPLTRKQLSRMVVAAERNCALWLNQHATAAVYSTQCTGEGLVSYEGDLRPCSLCCALLQNRIFRNSLSRKGASKGMWKFTPRSYRNSLAGKSYMRHEDVKEFMKLVGSS